MKILWCELTRKCNFECGHCYANSSPAEPLLGRMQVDDWKAVIGDGATADFEGVQFIGGEPTLHPHLYELIKYAKKDVGYTLIELFSNFGRNLNWACLKENEVSLATSFYATDINLHEEMTKNRSSYHKIIANIVKTIGMNLNLRVSIIKNDRNWHTVDETQSFLENLGVINIGFDEERKIGRASSKMLSIEELDKQLCGACGKNRLMINSDGDVYPCIMSTHRPLGNVFDHLTTFPYK